MLKKKSHESTFFNLWHRIPSNFATRVYKLLGEFADLERITRNLDYETVKMKYKIIKDKIKSDLSKLSQEETNILASVIYERLGNMLRHRPFWYCQ